MRYNTIVEKDEDNLNMIIDAVSKFSRERFLEGIKEKRYTLYDVNQMINWVCEYQQKLNRESAALSKFSETFIQEYATDNNQCFETVRKMFNRIRSSIRATRRVYQKTCPRIRRQQPRGMERPSVYARSYFSREVCTPDLFGIQSFDDAIGELYARLETFFVTIINTLALCHQMIRAEHAVRLDDERCLSIYNDCCAKVMGSVRDLAKFLTVSKEVNESDLLSRRLKARRLSDFACENYHRVNKSEFSKYLVLKLVQQGQDDGLTEVESLFWPNDHGKALEVRQAVERFDELQGAEGQKGKLDSGLVVEFLKWCGVDAAKEKKLYEEYFCRNYRGRFQLLSWQSVSRERKNRKDARISNEELVRSFEKILNSLVA